MTARSSLGWTLLVSALALGACVTPPRPLTPRVSLGEAVCATAPDLAAARAVQLKESDKTVVDVGNDAACLAADDRRSTYAVFRLPAANAPYIVRVSSEPRGSALFSPRLMVLDGEGAVRREIARESFLFHGTALQAAFRAAPGDSYLVVASDPASVGRDTSHIAGSVQTSTVPVGTGSFIVFSGSETKHDLTYAHNGSITVSAEPLPMVK